MKIDEFTNLSNSGNSKLFIEDYINTISMKCKTNIPNVTKKMKIEDLNIATPTANNYNDIIKYNYNIQQLKGFAKIYNLKVGGKKEELTTRLFTFLYLSSFIIKIQKVFKGFLQRKYNAIQGPGFKKINLCTNSTDFITMEELKDIKRQQFFSYKDEDGFIYGFDIASLYTLVFKNGITDNKNKKYIGGKNPYNRKYINDDVVKNIRTFIRLSKALKTTLTLDVEDDVSNISNEKMVELRIISLFQNINALGNYSDAQWFLSLNRISLVKFLRELMDIWHYRAQLSIVVKRNICPPLGDPFINQTIQHIQTDININLLRKIIVDILEKLVNSGIDQDSKSLGAYYVLAALTLVNESASTALPWLFQSVSHF